MVVPIFLNSTERTFYALSACRRHVQQGFNNIFLLNKNIYLIIFPEAKYKGWHEFSLRISHFDIYEPFRQTAGVKQLEMFS